MTLDYLHFSQMIYLFGNSSYRSLSFIEFINA